jgi:hypothetical protein
VLDQYEHFKQISLPIWLAAETTEEQVQLWMQTPSTSWVATVDQSLEIKAKAVSVTSQPINTLLLTIFSFQKDMCTQRYRAKY